MAIEYGAERLVIADAPTVRSSSNLKQVGGASGVGSVAGPRISGRHPSLTAPKAIALCYVEANMSL